MAGKKGRSGRVEGMADKTVGSTEKATDLPGKDSRGKFAGHSPGKTKGCMGGRTKALLT